MGPGVIDMPWSVFTVIAVSSAILAAGVLAEIRQHRRSDAALQRLSERLAALSNVVDGTPSYEVVVLVHRPDGDILLLGTGGSNEEITEAVNVHRQLRSTTPDPPLHLVVEATQARRVKAIEIRDERK